MKKFFVVFAILGTTYFTSAQSNNWATLKDKESGFQMEFPCKTQKKTPDSPAQKGPVTKATYNCFNTSGGNFGSYRIDYLEYPKDYFPDGIATKEAQDAFLEDSVNNTVNTFNGKLLSKGVVDINGYPGRKIQINIANDSGSYTMNMMTVLVGYEYYIIQTLEYKDKTDEERTKRFFDSFELIKTNSD